MFEVSDVHPPCEDKTTVQCNEDSNVTSLGQISLALSSSQDDSEEVVLECVPWLPQGK